MLGQENKQTFCIFEIEVKQSGAELGQAQLKLELSFTSIQSTISLCLELHPPYHLPTINGLFQAESTLSWVGGAGNIPT